MPDKQLITYNLYLITPSHVPFKIRDPNAVKRMAHGLGPIQSRCRLGNHA